MTIFWWANNIEHLLLGQIQGNWRFLSINLLILINIVANIILGMRI